MMKKISRRSFLQACSVAAATAAHKAGYGPVVQLVRTLACHARGRQFEPDSGRHLPL